MEDDNRFDAQVRENGNSLIITIPIKTIRKLKLKKKDIIEVAIRRPRNMPQ
ncbi:hypothetical protein HYW76_01900 [Candidatus Pacearchaeota archaeon]|nr:hypothetical protein [Candidatus Pacearchaeota archaeon]